MLARASRNVLRGIGFSLKRAKYSCCSRGEFFGFRRVSLGSQSAGSPSLDDGLHGRLVDDLLHGLRRARQELGHGLREACVRVHVRHILVLCRLRHSVELGPKPRRAALQHAGLAVHRRKQQLLLSRQQAAWRIPVEEIAEPAAESKGRQAAPAARA